MLKNGLFLCSIGFLIVLFSLNPMAAYDWYSFVTGLFFITIGGFFFFKGKKREEAKGGDTKWKSNKN
ncbi:MAG: DUF3188 domain-containing protein [Enterococcus sp.]